MIGRRIFAGSLLVALGLLLAGCDSVEPPPYHYKLTAEVATPAGILSGSSVIGVRMYSQIKGTEGLGGGGNLQAFGEAAAVDLPNGRILFVLLRSKTNVDWAGSVHVRNSNLKRDQFASLDEYKEALRNDRVVHPLRRWIDLPNQPPIDNYPLLVTFRDINDPKSVKQVDPDDLQASFGPGYQLKSLTVQGTSEPVSKGIERRLPWLPKHRGTLKPNPPATMNDPTDPNLRLLDTGPFSTEIYK